MNSKIKQFILANENAGGLDMGEENKSEKMVHIMKEIGGIIVLMGLEE